LVAGSIPAERARKINLPYMKNIAIIMALILMVVAYKQRQDIRELNTRIDELAVIVDQKFLPAMILDTLDVR